VKDIMAQGVLPFKYENEEQKAEMTGFGGLPLYLDLAHVMGLSKSVEKNLGIRRNSQGWSDGEIVLSLILLNLSGGDCVEDLNRLERDDGFCRILERTQTHGMSRRERRALSGRWRKGKRRSVPSPSSIFRYLSAFTNPEQDESREIGKAFIPDCKRLEGFSKVNGDFLSFVQKNNPEKIATLDMDATLVETTKSEALFCYKGFRSYQPLNTWWAEQGVVVHTEFRDGNVPAGFDQLRVLTEALKCLPEGVEQVRVRSDTAGYQHDLLKYCDTGENERFGKIEMDWDGEELIRWSYKRCGKSEEAHSVMKDDLAGGKLPSDDFGSNAAWWWIMILSLNLNAAMKRLVLGQSWIPRRMKAIRFHLINLPARIMTRSPQLLVPISNESYFEWFVALRERISALGFVSSG
jgi:hypothetical protein